MQTIWGGNNGLVGSAFGFGPCDPRVWFHAYFLFSVCYSSWDILQQQQLSILLCPKQSTAALHSPLSWARFSNCIYDDFSHFLSAPKFLLQHFWACLSHAFPVGSKRALPRAMRFPGDALPGRCASPVMRFPGDALSGSWLPGWCCWRVSDYATYLLPSPIYHIPHLSINFLVEFRPWRYIERLYPWRYIERLYPWSYIKRPYPWITRGSPMDYQLHGRNHGSSWKQASGLSMPSG